MSGKKGASLKVVHFALSDLLVQNLPSTFDKVVGCPSFHFSPLEFYIGLITSHCSKKKPVHLFRTCIDWAVEIELNFYRDIGDRNAKSWDLFDSFGPVWPTSWSNWTNNMHSRLTTTYGLFPQASLIPYLRDTNISQGEFYSRGNRPKLWLQSAEMTFSSRRSFLVTAFLYMHWQFRKRLNF